MTGLSVDDRVQQALRGGGEMGALIRAFDWNASPLGPVTAWPQSLRTAVALLLSTRHPMFIWWGPDLIQFYNDAYRRSLGSDRHPSALGARGRECWAEIWPVIGPEVESVMAGGEATWHEDHLVPITRGHHVQDVYWSYSYSPILHDDGGVGGVLVTVQETTKRVVTERRARLLQELAARELLAESEADVIEAAAAVLTAHPADVPFAALYLSDPATGHLWLARSVGLPAGHPAAPATLDPADDAVWPVRAAMGGTSAVFADVRAAGGDLRREPATDPVREALVVPLLRTLAGPGATGLLVAGINPRLMADEETRTFLDQVAREITHALDHARAEAQVRHAWRVAQQAAAERDAERQQLLTVLEQSPVAIVLAHAPSGRITFVNERVRQLFGEPEPSEEIEAYTDRWRGVHPDGRPLAREEWPLPRALRLGELVANETMLIEDLAGRRSELVVNAAPVRDAQGAIIAGVLMCWDVTAERRTERRLRDAERLQSVGTLAGGVAHEVNNQMTTVLGFGEFILRALGPDHPQAADLRIVLTAADRTARITHQLLTFSRKQVTQPRIVDLHGLAVSLGPVLRQVLGSDKVLTITGAADARPVAVDPTQVEQVLINLVGNARDATDTGGRVTIGVENVDIEPSSPTEREGYVAPGHYVLMTVSDTGHGMDAGTLARVFEPFFTTKDVGEGTGLGLSMVYGIVKRHSGYVWAESERGQGTTMKLYWPAAVATAIDAPAAAARLGSSDEPAGQEQAATVLVVEDEPAVRELVARILTSEGYDVLSAEDGRAALRLLERQPPARLDLVLTDVLMPSMNGRQLGDALHQRHPGLPVLYMSGDIGEAIIARHLVPEGATLLRKPFSPSQLMEHIAAVLA
jgi:signal transduction histidine kinase